jgi:hypothetical protein
MRLQCRGEKKRWLAKVLVTWSVYKRFREKKGEGKGRVRVLVKI